MKDTEKKKKCIIEKRPWGSYEILHVEAAKGFQVKRVEIAPGARLSLQSHARRTEIWTVASGNGLAIVDGKEIPVSPGTVITVPQNSRHRMWNKGNKPLVFIEVQLGAYLGEDDIQRFEDDYNRI
jgi:mannose-6-phosphate isomerase-like protein (cupin superfamily)